MGTHLLWMLLASAMRLPALSPWHFLLPQRPAAPRGAQGRARMAEGRAAPHWVSL